MTAARGGGFVLAVHGGAGTITRTALSAEQEARYRAGLQAALMAGHAAMAAGGSALQAVVAAVVVLEDNPLFNAGRGSVFTNAGRIEMDAAVMCGATHRAGAVAGVTRPRNPVRVAQGVMEKTAHVLLGGEGADAFAAEQGFELAPPEYFHTEHRWQQLERARAQGRVQLDHTPEDRRFGTVGEDKKYGTVGEDKKYGTVGAVACDLRGHLAAATSTGGLTNKLWGRIGDTPLVGAGTWAEDATAAVSCTGTGEFFMRGVVGHDIAARMRYGGATLTQAASAAVQHALSERGGTGGLIAVNAQRDVVLPFNSEGMYRGWVREDGRAEVAIYRD